MFHSHNAISLLALAISGAVFWPYFAGAATLAIGLAAIPKDIRYAHGIDKFGLFGPLLFAIAMAIFGADHLTAAKFVATIVPSWMPGHLFWAYFVGFALIAAALSLATKIQARLAAGMLGFMIFCFVLMIHLPNLVKAPHQPTALTILLRDLSLSVAAVAFAASTLPHGTLQPAQMRSGNLVTLSRFLMAVPLAVFGIDHFLSPGFAPGFPQENPALFISMPGWIPAHYFWGYATGSIFVICAAGLTIPRFARGAANALGLSMLLALAFVYVPLTIAKASDIANGLNYLAIHCALAGAGFMLASATPAAAEHSISFRAVDAKRPEDSPQYLNS